VEYSSYSKTEGEKCGLQKTPSRIAKEKGPGITEQRVLAPDITANE